MKISTATKQGSPRCKFTRVVEPIRHSLRTTDKSTHRLDLFRGSCPKDTLTQHKTTMKLQFFLRKPLMLAALFLAVLPIAARPHHFPHRSPAATHICVRQAKGGFLSPIAHRHHPPRSFTVKHAKVARYRKAKAQSLHKVHHPQAHLRHCHRLSQRVH